MNTKITEQDFENYFNQAPEYKVRCGGRVEILGNHTDHNHGLCIAATCDLQIYGYLKERKNNSVEIFSIGYTPCLVSLDDLEPLPEDFASSRGLVKGVAKYFLDHGYQIGGFSLFTDSSIFPGAGVSSSAAFESLVGQIFNVLFNEGKISKISLAKAGQFAENNYFGKKSGLLDQIGTGFGDISYIDFENIANPRVETIDFPFDDLHFVIINTGGSHAELNDLYSSIPENMWSAAKKIGHEFLREGTLQEIGLCPNLTKMEYNRAKHFYDENERVAIMKRALLNKDRNLFLKLVNESRKSSTELLKNMMVGDQYEGSPLQACDRAMKIMEDKGACRINGGGFAGSIICVVPNEYLETFIQQMGEFYGDNNVKEVHVNKNGPIVERL